MSMMVVELVVMMIMMIVDFFNFFFFKEFYVFICSCQKVQQCCDLPSQTKSNQKWVWGLEPKLLNPRSTQCIALLETSQSLFVEQQQTISVHKLNVAVKKKVPYFHFRLKNEHGIKMNTKLSSYHIFDFAYSLIFLSFFALGASVLSW